MNHSTAATICAALIVAGCASANLPAVDALPVDYRQLARDHVRDHFPDSSKIRDAQIAPPRSTAGSALVDAGQIDYWAVCLRTKTKGSPGVHAGAKDTVLLIRGNQVMDAQESTAGTNFCKGALFEPFPELMQGA
jgi:hypothetical protein